MAQLWGQYNTTTSGRPLAIHTQAWSAVAIDVSSSDFTTEVHGGINLFVWGAGNIKVDMAVSWTVTLTGVVAGTFLPIKVSKVYNTGTTATNITWIY